MQRQCKPNAMKLVSIAEAQPVFAILLQSYAHKKGDGIFIPSP